MSGKETNGKNAGARAVCTVCAHHCSPADGGYGLCGARKNESGRIICANYGQITSLALDPIEKKPLARFRPGSMILSAGSFGCSMSCPFCQNHEIAQDVSPENGGLAMSCAISPAELADMAADLTARGNIGLAFTYNEPLVGWEFVRDTAKLAQRRGLVNVMVTNGFAGLHILEELLPYTDAMNIDLKGFTDSFYRRLGGDLEMVKSFIKRAAADCHVELTTLIIPGENDSEDEMEAEAKWIASVDDNIPLHVTRFFPRYKMTDGAPTDAEQVYRLRDVAKQHLRYVYTGNC